MAGDRLALAQALCARLCHDLGGPVGSLAAVMELGPDGGPEAEELARDSVDTLRRRIRLFRLLAGTEEALPLAGLTECLDGMLAHGRVGLDTRGVRAGSAIPAAAVPAAIAAIMLAGEALPRGGRVVLEGDPATDLRVTPEGRDAAWPPTLATFLSDIGTESALTPRTVLAHWLWQAASAAGIGLRLVPGAAGAALVFTRKC